MTPLQLSDLNYADLKRAIERYQSLDFKDTSISDADKLFRQIIKHFVTQTMTWKQPIIYRARRHTEKVLFDNTKELIYPRSVTTYGRLNDVGESIFYGASHHGTALLEMRPKLGDEITILESRLIKSDNAPKFMEVGVRELMIKQNHSPEFMKQNREILEKELGTEDNKKRYGLINDFLVSEMTKIIAEEKSYDYKATIAIGQFYTKGNPHTDGLIYPSISRKGADCIAIKPESYDRFYIPDRCFKIKIVKLDNEGIPTAYCVDNSINIHINGQITWT